MEGISHERERVDGITCAQLDEEEYGVDGEKDEDAVGFGERHLVILAEDDAVVMSSQFLHTRLRHAWE